MGTDTKEQQLCVILYAQPKTYFDETVTIEVRIEQLSDETPHGYKQCDEYAKRLYRDVGSRCYVRANTAPFGHGGLEACDVYTATVDQMKRRIVAIEHTHRGLEKIRLQAGYSDKFSDFIVRLCTALKTDTVIISNALRAIAYPRSANAEGYDKRAWTRYSARDVGSVVLAITDAIVNPPQTIAAE